MASDKTTGLLPQGNSIPFGNGSLLIDRLIGSGATSEVYAGRLPDDRRQPRVAIKAMKPLEFAKAREFFSEEAYTLARLPEREQETNKAYGLPETFRVAPEFFGRSKYGDIEFLVMAWIEGRQIPDLLADSADSRLPEQQALTAGFHLFRMLDLLHTHLRKTYIDLKLENLWWDGTPTDGQLRLTDFGTMENIESGDDRGVRRDLLVASTYLCKMLTGYMPDHIAGELIEQAVPIIQRSDITWGARQLLSRLLHPNVGERPQTAADVLNPGPPSAPDRADLSGLVGLMDLADYWRRPPELLVKSKDAIWEAALSKESAERAKLLGRARALLDIWAARASHVDAGRVAEEQRQLDELLQQSGALENGRNLFKSRSFSHAETLFTQGRRQSYEPARIALFRRWTYLAQMGLDPKVRLERDPQRDLEHVVNFLGQRNWDAAARQIDELRPALGQAAAFARLEADLQLYRSLDEADAARHRGDYSDAVAAYDRALDALKRLPEDREAILRDETGQLLPERERLAAQAAEKAGRSAGHRLMRQAKEHLQANSVAEAFRAARRALIVEAHDPRARLQELRSLVDDTLRAGNYELAAALAAIALETSGDPRHDVRAETAELQQRFRLANKLREAERALDAGNVAGFLAAASVAASLSVEPAHLARLLNKGMVAAKEQHDAATLRSLAAVDKLDAGLRASLEAEAGRIDRTWQAAAEEARRTQRERIKPVVDNLLSEAHAYYVLAQPIGPRRSPDYSGWRLEAYLHYLGDRRKALEEARRLAEQACDRARDAGHYRLDEAEQLLGRVNQFLARQESDDALARQGVARNAQQATEARQALAGLAAQLAPPIAADAQAQQQMARELLMGSRWYLSVVDPDDASVALWAEQAADRIDYLRPQEWTQVQQMAAARLENFNSALAQAEATFAAGELARDNQRLDLFLAPYEGTEEYRAFTDKLRQAAEWQAYDAKYRGLEKGAHHAAALAGLRNWLPLSLPAAFWERSSAARWLADTGVAAATEARRTMDQVRRPFAPPSSGLAAYNSPSPRDGGPSGGADAYAARQVAPLSSPAVSEAAPGPRQAVAGPEAFLVVLKWWLDAVFTARRVEPSAQAANGGWDADAFLTTAAGAAVKGDAAALERAVEGAALPADVDSGLEQMTIDRWRRAVDHWRVAPTPVPDEKPAWLRWLPVGAAVAGLILLLAVLGFIFRDELGRVMGGTIDPTPAATAVMELTPNGGLGVVPTPAVTPSLAPSTTPTPSITPTPIPTNTATPSPTSTVAPAPPESSAYFVADPALLAPAAPLAGATLWLLSPTDVAPALDGGAWQTDQDPILGEIQYIEDFTNPVSLTWVHDQPLPEGLYQIYVQDTTVRSLGSQTFEVFLDGQPAAPARGVSDAWFSSQTTGQAEPAWLPIGAYQVANGQRLSARVAIDSGRSTVFASVPMLVARLGDRERDLLLALPEPSAGRPLVALLDDDRIALLSSNADATQFNSNTTRWPAEQQETAAPAPDQPAPPVWNGRYFTTALDLALDTALRAEWQPAGRLPAGDYQIYAHIPAGSTALVNYELLADGAPVEETILTNTQQREFAGQWVDLGIWTLPAEASVGVRATSFSREAAAAYPGETVWNFGVDAVALLRVGE